MTDKLLPERFNAELLPCPFCGSDQLEMDMVAVKNVDGEEPSIVIECPTKNCAYGQFSRGHKIVAANGDVAAKLWNTRAIPRPEPLADDARLKALAIIHKRKKNAEEGIGQVKSKDLKDELKKCLEEDDLIISVLTQPAAIDLEAMKKEVPTAPLTHNAFCKGYNQAIDDLKAKGFIRSDDSVEELVEVLKKAREYVYATHRNIAAANHNDNSPAKPDLIMVDAALAKHGYK